MSSSASGDEVDEGSQIIQIDSTDDETRTGTNIGHRKYAKVNTIEENCSEEERVVLKNRGNESSQVIQDEKFGFDFTFVRRFFHLHGLLFLNFRSLSTVLFIFLLALSLLEEYIVYRVGLIASKYYEVLGAKDLNGFWRQTIISIGIIFAICFCKSTKVYISKVLTATWRQLLSKAAHRLYFSDNHYYQLNVLDKVIDNPDQRITQDIDKFCTTYCDILPKILISPFVIAYYTQQSYSRCGWHGPTACFGFFILATFLNKLLMGPIVRLVVKQEKCEGDFRFIHLLVRVNSESIAFHSAANLEARKANESLDDLISVQHSLYCKQYILNFAVNLFNYAGSILTYLVLAVPIFTGSYDNLSPSQLSAVISATAFVNMYLIYCFTSLVELSSQITDVAGVSHRIAQLLERINALNEFWNDLFPKDEDSCDDLDKYDEWIKLRSKRDTLQRADESGDNLHLPLIPAWTLENISYSPPLQTAALVSGLTLQINAGESLLIVGNSSAGKSSLLRILRGLWPHSEGSIKRHLPPGPCGAFYCPQKPYLTVGTLREQACFPLRHMLKTDEENETLFHYMTILNLMPLMERVGGLDCPVTWNVYDSLSPGEMQRLSFLRIFYHRPMIAVLDEATSALPMEMEDLVYSECRRLGISFVSVGHRASLRRYHNRVLSIDSRGSWTISHINED